VITYHLTIYLHAADSLKPWWASGQVWA